MNLTKKEAYLVKLLLELYDATKNCKSWCECEKCVALSNAGDQQASTFNSLKEKVESCQT